MKITQQIYLAMMLGFSLIQTVNAKAVTWCVYDFSGNNGDIMQIMKDYVLVAKSWGVETKLQVYSDDQKAVADFKNKKCDAVVASTYITREYNPFLSTVSAIGLIPNNQVAQQVFLSLGDPSVAKYMVHNGYEGVGWIPIGAAYFMVKDRQLNSITHLVGKRVGVMREDPSHERLVRRIGAKPVIINFQNAANYFIQDKIDVLSAPIYAYRPFELHRGLGDRGGVINIPVSYVALSMIIRQNAFPAQYGQKSRSWFKERTPRMMHNILKWEKSMPSKYWHDVPINDRNAYQRLGVQLRKEFITSGVYHRALVNLVLIKHCLYDAQYFECKK